MKVKAYIPASPERTDAISKNDDERGRKEMEQQKAHAKTVKKFKAWQKPKTSDIDKEVLHKTQGRW